MSCGSISQYCYSEEESGVYCTKKVYSKAAKRKRFSSMFFIFKRKTKLFYFIEEFDNYMQQDAHEFLNFLINHISEIILGKYNHHIRICIFFIIIFFVAERQQNSTTNNIKSKAAGENGTTHTPPEPTWVHEIFQVNRNVSQLFSIVIHISGYPHK